MKRLIPLLLSVLVAPLALLVVTAPSASAYAGCESLVRSLGDPWNENTGPVLLPGKMDVIDANAELVVIYCPNNERPNKFHVFNYIQWCFSSYTTGVEANPLQGVKFNAYIYDSSGKNVNPPRFTVPRDKPYRIDEDNPIRNTYCKMQMMPFDQDEVWMQLRNEPRWKATFRLAVAGQPDFHVYDFRTGSGGTVNHLIPDAMRVRSNWHLRTVAP